MLSCAYPFVAAGDVSLTNSFFLFLPGATKVRVFGMVHTVRVQRRRPQRVRHLLGEAPLLRLRFVANRPIHGESLAGFESEFFAAYGSVGVYSKIIARRSHFGCRLKGHLLSVDILCSICYRWHDSRAMPPRRPHPSSPMLSASTSRSSGSQCFVLVPAPPSPFHFLVIP